MEYVLVSIILSLTLFNHRSPLPRYTSMWDVDVILRYTANLPQNDQLKLPVVTHKSAMLLALANANCGSELAALDLEFVPCRQRKLGS